MFLSRRLLAVLAALCATLSAQSPLRLNTSSPGPPSLNTLSLDTLCAATARTPVPPSLLPSAAHAAKLAPGCSQLQLYYATTPGHFEQARLCGLAQWQRGILLDGQHSDSPRVASSEFLALAMVFANGKGAPRNLPLARRFACLAGDDGFTDTENVLKAIDAGELEVCSEDGSFFGRQPNFECLLVLGARVSDELRQERANARKVLPPGRWAALQSLESARAEYLEAHGPELPNGNTGAAQSGMDDMLNLDRAWIGVLRSVEKSELPQGFAHAVPFAEADKQLNQQYADRLKQAAEYPSMMSAAELRTAERAWLRYREAWVRFGTACWPHTSADQWRAWLTSQRMEEMD